MEEERYPSLPWQGWKIVKRLGRGGYGSVYIRHSEILQVSWKMPP